jgi:hypothetical protein
VQIDLRAFERGLNAEVKEGTYPRLAEQNGFLLLMYSEIVRMLSGRGRKG